MQITHSNNIKPVISVKHTNRNDYGYQLEIKGPCRIVYNPHEPAQCGAHLWIDTFSRVQFVDTNFNPISACRAYRYISVSYTHLTLPTMWYV